MLCFNKCSIISEPNNNLFEFLLGICVHSFFSIHLPLKAATNSTWLYYKSVYQTIHMCSRIDWGNLGDRSQIQIHWISLVCMKLIKNRFNSDRCYLFTNTFGCLSIGKKFINVQLKCDDIIIKRFFVHIFQLYNVRRSYGMFNALNSNVPLT